MAYTLGSITLKNPYKMEIEPVQIMASNTTLAGSTRRDYVRQKNRYILELRHLTQSQVLDIIDIYNGKEPVNFSVSDGDLEISSVSVFVDIRNRSYTTRGSEYRENMVLVLEEV